MSSGTIRLSVKPYIDRAKLSDITLTDEEIGQWVKAALRSSCKLLRDYARTHHRYKDVTGTLTKGIRYNVSDGTRSKNVQNWYGKVGYVNADARPEYAKWQLYGTGLYGAHRTEVVPKSASFLRFKGTHGQWKNRWFSLRSARGIKGQDYLRNALVKNRAKIDEIFEETLQMMLKNKKG